LSLFLTSRYFIVLGKSFLASSFQFQWPRFEPLIFGRAVHNSCVHMLWKMLMSLSDLQAAHNHKCILQQIWHSFHPLSDVHVKRAYQMFCIYFAYSKIQSPQKHCIGIKYRGCCHELKCSGCFAPLAWAAIQWDCLAHKCECLQQTSALARSHAHWASHQNLASEASQWSKAAGSLSRFVRSLNVQQASGEIARPSESEQKREWVRVATRDAATEGPGWRVLIGVAIIRD